MNDSDIFLMASSGGGGGEAVPVWSCPMQLKHLDIVRSDIDSEHYTILNNNPVASTITVGPGNPTTSVAAWLLE